jgi:hypothetical protein
MPRAKCVWFVLGLATLCFHCVAPDTFGQAAAFTPNIGAAPTGQTMTVTPAVSPDRRYVRLTVVPFFNVVNGFSTFTTPLGAVAGSGGNPGGGLGGGGLGGGLGGVGGLRSVGGLDIEGGTLNVGMNGVIGPAGLDGGVGFAPSGFVGQTGEMRAGGLPYDGGFGYGLSVGGAPGSLGWNDGDFLADQPRRRVLASPSEVKQRRTTPAAVNDAHTSRPAIRNSAARREKARSAHAAKLKKASDEEPVIKPKAASSPDPSD